jgi:hypothetical protein
MPMTIPGDRVLQVAGIAVQDHDRFALVGFRGVDRRTEVHKDFRSFRVAFRGGVGYQPNNDDRV